MLKVLIVDDEKSIREGLRYVIEWEKYGFEVIGTARNGVDALGIIKDELPHLVVTDIKMPEMTGLELVENARMFNQDINFVILSGYDDFEYAKKAISYNVKEYLLKPIEEEELIAVLIQIKEEWKTQKTRRKQQMYSFLHQLVNGSLERNAEVDRIITEQFGEGSVFHYINVELDEDETTFSTIKHNNRVNTILVTMLDCIKELIGEEEDHFIITEGFKGHSIVIGSKLLNRAEMNITQFAVGLKHKIITKAQMKVSVMVGKTVDTIYNVSKSKESINICKKHRFYRGTGQVLLYKELVNRKFHESLNDTKVIDELFKVIKKGSLTVIEAAIDKFTQLLTKEMISPDTVKVYVNNIVMDLIKVIDEMHGDTTKIASKYSMFNRINDKTINMFNLFLKELYIEIAAEIQQLRKKKSMGVVGEITEYIHENYTEQIDLKSIAKLYYINTSYLGQLFKKKTGITFNTYLNQVRIDKAKELLHEVDLKIYQIAQSVGYSDPNYFCIKFEEYEHVTPSRYREEIVNVQNNQ